MKFYTFGSPNNKAILLIHTLFTDANFFEPITDILAEKYFVITVTLSGHYPNSTYQSTEEEIRQIKTFLNESNISSLYVVAGFSLGGNIAYNFFSENTSMIEKAIIDSAPLFCFPKFIRKHFYKKYSKCLKKIKLGNCDVAKELNKCFNGMGELQKKVAPIVSYDSLRNLVESCYYNKKHKLSKAEISKITFVYGTKDVARLCKYRIRKYHIRKMKGLGHCGLYHNDPLKWVKEFIL
ncbi:MAG TPA: hypothetical protein DCY93_01960 [Firmicutes bacterium]|nr:hypothetical protein [Bacillota bacterium]